MFRDRARPHGVTVRGPLAALLLALRLALLLPLLVAGSPAQADVRDAVGYAALRARTGARLPVGRGVPVVLVEGVVRDERGREAWLPDRAEPGFAGVTFTDATGGAPWVASRHATGVARALAGRGTTLAPGIGAVTAYASRDWLGTGYLQAGFPAAGLQPVAVAARVANHSWVGDTPIAGEVLRRVDWVIDRDEFIQVVGVTNSGPPPALLAGAFNAIAVGRTAGSASGTAPVDYLYTRERARPDLVVPVGTTSEATPYVAAAAALLVGVARDRPELSRDPVARSTLTRAAGVVWNAGRAEVVRAVLMAGAARRTPPGQDPAIRDYAARVADRTRNGLDRRFGAGQLDIDSSHRILAAGEQESSEDARPGSAPVALSGFDYDPAFGGARGANARATYRLPAAAAAGELRATLVWHLAVDGGSATAFDGAATLYNLDLRAWDVTGPGEPRLLAESASTIDNTESVWVAVPAGRICLLEVVAGPGGDAFRWDYALAWELGPAPAVSGTR